MFHRFSSWWRALCVVLISLATITWPHVSVAATTVDLVLNHQDTVATMNSNGIARFSATFVPSSTAGTTVQAVIYPPLVGTSQLIGVAEGKGPCGESPLDIRLKCQRNFCDGVYPVQYVTHPGTQILSTWALVTVSNNKITHPVDVVPLLTMDAGSVRAPSQLTALLQVLANYPSTPITLATNYQALEQISIAPRAVSDALHFAVDSLMHRVISTPSTQIDFGQLSANGLDSQVQQQLNLTNEFLYLSLIHISEPTRPY